jgi:hypothetical protein
MEWPDALLSVNPKINNGGRKKLVCEHTLALEASPGETALGKRPGY